MKTSETEVCKHIIEHFAHAEVFSEVECTGGFIDIVVKDGNLIIAIEAKTSLSMAVIQQAYGRMGKAHMIYVATPSQPSDMMRKFLQFLGIGCLVVSMFTYKDRVYEAVKPKKFRRINPPKLHEYMKQSEAGSQSNRVTSFGHFVDELKRQLEAKKDGATYKELFEERTYTHYHQLSSFKANVYQYVRKGVITDIEIEKGKLILTKYKSKAA
jgi:Holliday junction resolvase-like predicted endonuclease